MATRNIAHKVAVVTGAAGGIGEAVACDLAHRGARAVILVDRSEQVNEVAKDQSTKARSHCGDRPNWRHDRRGIPQARLQRCHGATWSGEHLRSRGRHHSGLRSSVRIDKETGKAELYPVDSFRQVTEVNLIAPIYWAIEMIARIAEDRRQRGLKRWEPEENGPGSRRLPGLGLVARQQGPDLLCRRQGGPGRSGCHPDEGSHFPRRALRDHPSWIYRHTDGQSTGRGVPRQVRAALHATAPPDST